MSLPAAANSARAVFVDPSLQRVAGAGQLEPLVNSAISWFDPGEVVFSSPLPESIMVRLAARLNQGRLRWPEHRKPTEIRVSRLGGSSIALGAALLPIHAATTVSFW